jgi:hypothetical protein
MRTSMLLRVFWLAIAVLFGCGGSAVQAPPDGPAPLPPPEHEDRAEVAPEVEAPEDEDPAETAETETATEPPRAPAAPPLTSPTQDQIREALLAAASDVSAFKRLVDPEFGIGVIEDEIGMIHHCDIEGIASAAGIGFVFGTGDTFRCDRNLRRCVVQEQGGRGYAFHFREGRGDTVWLDAIVHYPRRVPSSENARARAFVNAGEGVCALYRSLQSGEAGDRLSVFVASHTGLVPETLAEHRCGDEAAASHAERVAPLASSAPEQCARNPTRCTFDRGDEDVTVYGGAGGPTAVAVTRPGMTRNLATVQDREREAFVRAASRHTCN